MTNKNIQKLEIDGIEIPRINNIDKESNYLLKRLVYLKNIGVVDTNINMFLAIITGNNLMLNDALENGANPNMTDSHLLFQYANLLRGFVDR